MPIAVSPRRVASTSTAVAINSANTALSAAAAAVASNTFSVFEGAGLTATTVHPITGRTVTCLESGGPDSDQVTGWCGKGWYDPTRKWVGFLGTAAGSNNYVGGYVENCYTRYEETGARANTWWAPHRAELPPNEPDTTLRGWVHQYDSNCIHVAGRKVYRKYGAKQTNPSLVVYDLDTDVQLNTIYMPTAMSNSFWYGGMDCVPTRGAGGALWYLGWTTSNLLQLWEYDIALGTWSVLKTAADLGNQGSQTIFSAPVISYNPRAFGGAGGVMIGNENDAKTINCSTLAMTTISLPPTNSICINHPANGLNNLNSGFCRDPVGTGWLQISQGFRVVYRWNGSSWDTRATTPSIFSGTTAARNFIVIPIDEYGVVWMVNYEPDGGGNRGWLYRP